MNNEYFNFQEKNQDKNKTKKKMSKTLLRGLYVYGHYNMKLRSLSHRILIGYTEN